MPVSERLLAQLAKFREHWNNTKRKVEEENPRPFLLADLLDVSVATDGNKKIDEEPNWLQRQILLAEKKGRPISRETMAYANDEKLFPVPKLGLSQQYKNGGKS